MGMGNIMGRKTKRAPLLRSSPRKRGPRAARKKELDSCLRRNEREELVPPALYRLMAWLSPAFPVGAFSYSSGIEWAVEAGDIKDAETLKGWLGVMLAEGGGFCDAVFFAHAHRGGCQRRQGAAAVAELAAALHPSKERHLETTAQGNAFIEAVRAAWPSSAIDRLKAVWTGPVAYPVAVAVAAAATASRWSRRSSPICRRRRQLGLGRGAADPARPDRRPARAGRARTRRRHDRPACAKDGARRHRLVPPSAPISPAPRHETQYTRLFRS